MLNFVEPNLFQLLRIMCNSIAVLITCFNRKDKTLKCLSKLYAQRLPEGVSLSVYLVDDSSTDGTQEAVKLEFPKVVLLEGDGNLFWNGGMRLAFDVATERKHDLYLWLNDDTFLYEDALESLAKSYSNLLSGGYSKSIVVGATHDQDTGLLSYGGVNRYSWWYPLKFVNVQPGNEIIKCDTMHGNCVLIPHEVVEIVGNLDSNFVHHLSDFDYGFRASKLGCSIWLLPKFVGTCSYHDPLWREPKLSLQEKLKAINHPKGLKLSEWKVYAQRHGGPFWPVYWLSPYVKLIVTSAFSSLSKIFI